MSVLERTERDERKSQSRWGKVPAAGGVRCSNSDLTFSSESRSIWAGAVGRTQPGSESSFLSNERRRRFVIGGFDGVELWEGRCTKEGFHTIIRASQCCCNLMSASATVLQVRFASLLSSPRAVLRRIEAQTLQLWREHDPPMASSAMSRTSQRRRPPAQADPVP